MYEAFADYVGELPLVSYHLQHDLDQVLLPQWERLGIGPIGTRGFCALRLAQRLLDPVPAGDCKLETLRQYFRMPQRNGHTALGNVETVVDLLGQVLRPIAEHRGLGFVAERMRLHHPGVVSGADRLRQVQGTPVRGCGD